VRREFGSLTGGDRETIEIEEHTMSSTPQEPEPAQTVSLADEEGVRKILATTVLQLWGAVNTLTRLRPSKRERYRVAIFGSARAQPGTFVYDEVKRVAAAFAAQGCDIVTGGGPGLMQAANEGASLAGARESVGIRVELPFEQDVNRSSHERSNTRPSSPACTISSSRRTPSS
jgi:hypothetical protein